MKSDGQTKEGSLIKRRCGRHMSPPFWWYSRLIPCKIILLGNKIIPTENFNFDPSHPRS